MVEGRALWPVKRQPNKDKSRLGSPFSHCRASCWPEYVYVSPKAQEASGGGGKHRSWSHGGLWCEVLLCKSKGECVGSKNSPCVTNIMQGKQEASQFWEESEEMRREIK